MKKTVLFASVLTAVVLLAAINLTGCNSDRGYDIYIYNSKGENARQFEEMTRAYTAETGIRIKSFSIGSGQDHSETLRAEMGSRNPPTIFSMQGIKELVSWIEGGYVQDLSLVEDHSFADLISGIAPSLRLSTGGNNSYGIPYNVEGYGYIVDTQMLGDIFGRNDISAILADIRTATYSEWDALVHALNNWITSPSALQVTLSGNTYTLASSKNGLAANLNGVFAVMGAEKWTYGDHFINVALNAVFDSSNDAFTASDDKVRSARPAFLAYAEALDLKTSFLAGRTGPAHRSQDFVSSANFGYDQTVQIFTSGRAVFFKQGNWAYGNIESINSEMADRLEFLPVKMPFTNAVVVRSGMTPQMLNNSIPVFVPNYYAVNARVSEEEKIMAYNFLLWLNTSAEGQRFIVEEFAFIPYNADPALTTVPNSLGNSILTYMVRGDIISAPYHGAPAPWSGDVVGLKVMEEYMTKETWTRADYEAIADFAVAEWLKLK